MIDIFKREVYIFGCLNLGEKVYQQLVSANINVKGFIDNNESLWNTKIHGLNVFPLKDLCNKKKDIVVIVATINYLYEIITQLEETGFENIVPVYKLNLLDENKFPAEREFKNILTEYKSYKEEYVKIKNLLKDELSKKTFDAIIEFRNNFDIKVYSEICKNIEKQYFEKFIPYNGEIFIDCGAFDGDTVSKFLEFSKNKYEKIYLFEPAEKPFLKAKENLKNIENIEFYKKGCFDKTEEVCFTDDGTLGSFINDDSQNKIECIKLDDLNINKRVFLKMDIEGAELNALKGAKNLIKKGSILSICVYHKQEDLRLIPQYILSINKNYSFYLRHYTKTIFDTVLYAIPKD